jgi:hypothetical protein
MMGVAGPPKPPRGGVTSLLAGVLALLAAGLTVGGLFGPISSYSNTVDFGDDESPTVFGSHQGWWGFTDNGSTSPIDDESSLIGLIPVLAAVLLVLGAVFMLVAARTRRSGPMSAGRSLITGGVGVLAGVGLFHLLDVLAQMSRYNERELDAGESLEFTAGLGLYLPLGGLVLGLFAVVLAHVGQRPAASRFEPNTPRMGFPAPYGYQQQLRPQPGAPLAERATEVEPSTENAGDDTQVVSNSTATGEPVGSSSHLSAALAGDPAPAGPAITSLTQPPATGPSTPAGLSAPSPFDTATPAIPQTAAKPSTTDDSAPASPSPSADSAPGSDSGSGSGSGSDRSATASAPSSSAGTAPGSASQPTPATPPAPSAGSASPQATPATPASAAPSSAGSAPGSGSQAIPATPPSPVPGSSPGPASPQATPASAAPSSADSTPGPATATPPPAANDSAEPAPLSDLPAAPPPPELSSSDEPKKDA